MYIHFFTIIYILKKKIGGEQVLCVFVCEVFVLHCFACCPLMSFGKCLVYISLHCSVCCPLMSFWKCLVYIVLCVVLWEVFGSLGMSLPRKTGGISWGCTKSGPSPFTVQNPP